MSKAENHDTTTAELDTQLAKLNRWTRLAWFADVATAALNILFVFA